MSTESEVNVYKEDAEQLSNCENGVNIHNEDPEQISNCENGVNIHNEDPELISNCENGVNIHNEDPEQISNSVQISNSENDGIIDIIKKSLDPNKYATKKTIAQGLLDVALLTANASQLKYVLQVGHKHEFYTLMLSLIIVSIILQIIQATLCIFLGTKLDINDKDDHSKAENVNNVVVLVNFLLMGVNIVINTFDVRSSVPGT